LILFGGSRYKIAYIAKKILMMEYNLLHSPPSPGPTTGDRRRRGERGGGIQGGYGRERGERALHIVNKHS